MTKKRNLELKHKNENKKVLEKSKKLKKTKASSEDKKKFQQIVTRKVNALIKETTGTSNGSAVKDVTKLKKGKHKENKKRKAVEVDPKDISDKTLSKIEKKRAKKMEKKLKKKQMKIAQKSENQNNAAKEVDDKMKIYEKAHPEEPSKTKQTKSQIGDRDNREPKKRDPIIEAATVFVGNLPVNTKRVQLIRIFSDYGPVNAIRFRTASGKVLFKHKHRKEAGSLNAWVVLKDEETAKRALELNGSIFKNNHLRVTSVELNSSTLDVKRTIFVGNLKYSANEEKLRDIFSSCGDIDYIRCLHDDKGCKGVAYVCFKTPESVGLALELNETMLDERPINVERYSVKKLGAKKVRDSTDGVRIKASVRENKLKDKKHKVNKNKNIEVTKSEKTSKKSKFRGVKIVGIKKKQKKITSQMQKLAMKIAPKEKS